MADPQLQLGGVEDHQVLLETVLSCVGSSFFPDAKADEFIVKQTGGTSGAASFFVTRANQKTLDSRATSATEENSAHRSTSNTVILKIEPLGASDKAESKFELTKDRRAALNRFLEHERFVPAPLYTGSDYAILPFLGVPVGSRFDFDASKAPLVQVAQLLAKFHALPTDWFDSEGFRQRIIEREPRLSAILLEQPAYSHCWQAVLPFLSGELSRWDTNNTLYEMLLEPQPNEPAGVFGKFLSCAAFQPQSVSGRRIVNFHGDYKADNVLLNKEANELVLIDFDGSSVGSVAIDLGFMFLRNGYLRKNSANTENFSKEQLRDQRLFFLKTYLEALEPNKYSDADKLNDEAIALLLDAEVATLTVVSGLFTAYWECEIALLRGREHPTKEGRCTNVERPTGSEIVDLLSEAIMAMRASGEAREAFARDGLVETFVQGQHVMVGDRGELMRKYLRHVIENDLG